MPCTVPSSPNGPCSIGITTSIGPTARTLLSVPPAPGDDRVRRRARVEREPLALGGRLLELPGALAADRRRRRRRTGRDRGPPTPTLRSRSRSRARSCDRPRGRSPGEARPRSRRRWAHAARVAGLELVDDERHEGALGDLGAGSRILRLDDVVLRRRRCTRPCCCDRRLEARPGVRGSRRSGFGLDHDGGTATCCGPVEMRTVTGEFCASRGAGGRRLRAEGLDLRHVGPADPGTWQPASSASSWLWRRCSSSP